MKIFKSNQGGFTLIELLVVVAIISLLSSIVLASLKDAKKKAERSKFRQEINQFINALELYNSSNGYYPFENLNSIYSYSRLVNNTENSSPSGNIYLLSHYDLLGKYISKTPEPVKSNGSTQISWSYRTNSGPISNTYFKCAGDLNLPKFVILVYSSSLNNTETFNAVSDWTTGYLYTNNGTTFTSGNNARCFSVK
jgi:prepilin-type N-terminal cleavage/methylation domain-containing protein